MTDPIFHASMYQFHSTHFNQKLRMMTQKCVWECTIVVYIKTPFTKSLHEPCTLSVSAFDDMQMSLAVVHVP